MEEKMFQKKWFIACAIAVLCVSGLFANGQKESASVIKQKAITIWSFNLSTDALATVQKEIIPVFEQANPGISVEWQNIPYTGYREKLLTAAAGEALPDIFIDGYNMLGTYYSAGIIEDMTSYTKEWSRWTEIDSSLTDLTYYNGDCYGFPFRTKVYPVLINTKIFKESGLDPDNPPSTWAEAIEAGKKMLKIENGVVTQLGASGFINTAGLVRGFDLFVQQDGGNFLNEDGTPGFNDQHGLNAAEFLDNLYRLQKPKGVAPLDESAMDAFVAGKSGMNVMGSYDAVQTALQTGNKEFTSFVKVIPPFQSGNANGKPVSFFDGDMLFVSSSSPNKDAAWDFIQYFYEPDTFMEYVKANKVIPIYQSLMDSDYMAENKVLQGLMEMQQYGGTLAATPAYRSARNFLADELEKSIEKLQSYQKALDNSEALWLREIEDLK
jgi:ABC-type glycerol-3-phosphate transport system substrate-binding protein